MSDSSSEKYYRIWNGRSSAWFVKPEELSKYKGQTERYASTYFYNEEHYKHFQKHKSVAGVTDVKTNQLWFDFDSHDDLNLPKKDAETLVSRLLAEGFLLDNIEIHYSSNKGFHVIVPIDQELTRPQVENVVKNLGKDLKTLDPSLYDWNQVLRIPQTRNQSSGLYKTQLSAEELSGLTIPEIKALAGSVTDSWTAKTAILPKKLLIEDKPEKKEVKKTHNDNDPLRISDIDFTTMPHGWKKYKFSLSMGRFEVGQRNFSMMVIASTCRALKYGREHTEAICLAADKLHCEITNDSEMSESDLHRQVLDVVFSTTWNGGQYSVENNAELREYCNKYGFKQEKEERQKILSLHEVNTGFKDFVKNIDKNTIKTGIHQLDEAVPITVGMNLGIIGAASAGKTAMALEILKHTSQNGVVSVIASLDMHRNRLFEKVLYKVSQDVYGKTLSRDELYKMIHCDEDGPLQEEVKKQFGNVFFYDRSRPSVSDLSQFIQDVESQTGQKVKLLMVDYFERIGSDITDATASSLKVANELQDLINDLNLAVITLVQPNKFSLQGGPDTPILSYTAIKGSSFLYQSFRAIVSIWRPFFTPKTKDMDKFLEMAILKNDLGEQDVFKFNWNGKTGSITEMTEEQEQLYDEYMEKKSQLLTPPPGGFRKPGSYG